MAQTCSSGCDDSSFPFSSFSETQHVVVLLWVQERFGFLMISYITAGILHVQLTVSHLATDAFTEEEEEEEQWVVHQMKTTRNIDSDWWNDWLQGGLQFQIEHHLFPQVRTPPRAPCPVGAAAGAAALAVAAASIRAQLVWLRQMPRHNLPKVKPLVEELCKQHVNP
eukprot:COSAG04_NODE_2958_length_3346_cov_4.979366_2_plen_167_part_00